ncbi:MAG: O-antigen ligase family protein [bacterium]|nr:O-antigen ligase family protein [bacterium]
MVIKFPAWLRRRTEDPVAELLWWVVRFGTLATLLLPLAVGSQFFFPFIVLKNVLFRSIVEVLAVAYAALAIRDPRFRPRWTPLTIAVLSFVGIAALTTLTGIEPTWGFWGNYERMGGLFGYLHVGAFFFIVANTFRRWEDWRSLLTFSIFVSTLMSLFALGQWLQIPFLLKSSGGARLTGTIGNATYLAGYLLFHLFFLAYFFIRDREFDVKLLWWSFLGFDVFLIGFDLVTRLDSEAQTTLISQLVASPSLLTALLAVQAAALAGYFLRHNRWVIRGVVAGLGALDFFIFYQTQTRGALIGLLAGLLMVGALFGFLRRRTLSGKISLGLLAAGMLTPVLLYLARDTAFVKSDMTLARLASISLEDVTSQSRLDTWRASWQGWTQEPVRFIIGYGLENYSQVFNAHFPARIFKDLGSQIWFDRAHNIILDTAVTTGLLGLAGFLTMFVVAGWWLARYVRRSNDLFGATLLGATLLGYLVQNMFVFDTLESFLLLHLVLAAIVVRGDEQPLPAGRGGAVMTSVQSAGLVGLGVAMLGSLYLFNYQLLTTNHKIYQALLTFSEADPEKQRVLFHEAIAGSYTGRMEARQQYATYALGLAGASNIPRATVGDVVRDSLVELRKSVDEEPTNIRNQLFYLSVANRARAVIADAPRDAARLVEQSINLSPTRPQLYFELGQAYLMDGNITQGLEYYRQGLALSSTVMESHIDMAVAFALATRPNDALNEFRIIKDELQRVVPEDQYLRVIRAAESASQWGAMIALYEDLLTVYPPTSEHYAKLATVYARNGDKVKARQTAERALQLDPGLQSDFDAFIKQLESKP